MTNSNLKKIETLNAKELTEFIRLMKMYFQELDQVPEFHGLDKDLTAPLAAYTPPSGSLWLAHGEDSAPALGMIGVLPINRGTCEIRRLYVASDVRHQGWGQALLTKAMTFARDAGYNEILCSLHSNQAEALSMFERNGFKPCARFNEDRKVGIFMSYKFPLNPAAS